MRRPAPSACAALLLGMLAIGSSGCMQEDERITLNPDGSGKFRYELKYDPRVAARAAEGMGRSPEAVRALLPDLESLLHSTIRGAQGVSVWSEARIDTDSSGIVRMVVGGYFEDITLFALGNPFASVMSTSAVPPSPLDFGKARFLPDSAGIGVLEFVPRADSAAKRPRTPPPPGADDREKLEEARMAHSVTMAMLMSLFKDARFHREILLPGEIIEAGIFERVDGHRARVGASLARLVVALSDVVKDDRIARRLLLGEPSATAGPFDVLQAAAADPEVDSLVTKAVLGRVGPSRITYRPGKALFDYGAESAAAAAGQSAQLRTILTRARASQDSQGHGLTVVAQPGLEVEIPEYNFGIKVPPDWVRFPAKQLHKDACLGLRQSALIFAAVVAESLETPLALDALEAFTESHVAAQPGARQLGKERVRIGGIPFGHLSATLVNPAAWGRPMRFEYWMASEGSFCWQFVVWGDAADSAKVVQGARGLVDGFRILDPLRAVRARPAVDVDRPAWGYALKGVTEGWSLDADTASALSSEFDLYWLRPREAVGVLPMRFEGPPPDLSALSRGLLTTLNFEYPAGGAFERVPRQEALGEGIEITTERMVDQATWVFLLRVVRGKRAAFLAAGWYDKKDGDPNRVRRALDALQLREPRGQPPTLTEAQRKVRATVLNGAGLSYVSRQSYMAAHPWFEAAYALDGADPAYLANTVGVLRMAGKAAEGLAYLSERIARFPENADLHLLLAKLQLDRGDAGRGNATFLEAMRLGLEDDDELFEWLQRMVVADSAALAVATATAWIEAHPGVKPRRWHAQVVRESGDMARALSLMKQLVTEYPDDPGLVADLGATLNMAGEHAQAGALTQGYLDRHGAHSQVLLTLGWSQMGRNWYREAKATFEEAARLAPEDEDVAKALREASRSLGQGANAEITTQIANVPVPAELERALRPMPPGFGQGFPAIVLLDSHGFSVEEGKPVRYTQRLHIRILSEEGASAYSTLEFAFQPSSQRAFINRIAVRNAAGSVVSTSSVDDAYVIDNRAHPASDDKLLHVQVRGVTPGATIESEVTIEDRTRGPVLDYTRRLLAGYLPTASALVFVVGDTSRYRAVLRNGADVSIVRGDRLAGWLVQPQRLEKAEPLATPVEDRSPILSLCKPESSWKAVGRGYLREIAESLEPDASVAGLSATLTAGARSEKDKIAKIVRFVQQQIHYKAIEFGPRANRPDKPSQVVTQRYGDCKDHALLIHQLLAAAGIPSQLALVNTNWRIEPDIPSLGQFDHMVVHLPALGGGWLLDATDKQLPLDALPSSGPLQSHALVLDPNEPVLLPPRDQLPAGSFEVSSDRTMTADGADWNVTETLTLNGYAAASFRGWLAGTDTSEQIRRIQDWLDDAGTVHVSAFRCDALAEASTTAVATLRYRVKNAVSARPDGVSAVIPAFVEQQYLGMAFVQDRQSAFQIRVPMHLRADVRLLLPKRPRAPVPGAPRTIRNGFCTWNVTTSAGATDREVRIQLEFQAVAGRHPPDRYAEMQDAWQAPLRAVAQRLEW